MNSEGGDEGEEDDRVRYLIGYGSYGCPNDLYFDFSLLPLLSRGIVVVFGHIRGGGDCGNRWYEVEGKQLTKKNTVFHSFDFFLYS